MIFLSLLSLCLFICQQDYAKRSEQVYTKLRGSMGHGPEKNPFNFEAITIQLLWILFFFLRSMLYVVRHYPWRRSVLSEWPSSFRSFGLVRSAVWADSCTYPGDIHDCCSESVVPWAETLKGQCVRISQLLDSFPEQTGGNALGESCGVHPLLQETRKYSSLVTATPFPSHVPW